MSFNLVIPSRELVLRKFFRRRKKLYGSIWKDLTTAVPIIVRKWWARKTT